MNEVNKWALLCVMHTTLARAGEVGGPEKFHRDKGLFRAHIIHFPHGSGEDTTPFAVVMLRPLKYAAPLGYVVWVRWCTFIKS